jgi:transglutaminase-like putative cysteine protease
MVRDRDTAAGQKAALAPRAKLPPDVAEFFQKTAGIDSDDKDVKTIASTVKTDTMANAIEGVLTWMRANFKYEGGGDQGGKASLDRKFAVCTGHANLAASLFQAAGVPCRVLGCLMGDRLQEHYIVEVWAPGAGWQRVESTTKAWPIKDSVHLILHVAHPKFFRSAGNVPLHVKGGDDCDANFKMGADTCWQGMTPLPGQALEPAVAIAVEKAARDAFAAWEKKPAATPSIRLLGADQAKRAPALAAEIDAFLSAK